MKTAIQSILILSLMFGAYANAEVTIFAAASLTNAINDINAVYEKQHKEKIRTSYASSGTLAKQIEKGAKADVFISADMAWGKYLQEKGKVVEGSYKHLLGNRLVLIAPKNSPTSSVKMDKSTDFSKILTGKLCTGNTGSVPVGKYAKQSLTYLGWWDSVTPKLVETEDVRAALNFVNRGECQLGIVYQTDVAVVKNVKTVGVFPLASHTPVVYPLVLINDNKDSRRYYQFLRSDTARAIYKKYGFSVL